jgi:L-threonine kinase
MIGRACGSFGELLQGALPDPPGGEGLDFLVTCPIDRWAVARFSPRPGHPLRVDPPGKRKALFLAQAMIRSCGLRLGGTLTLTSDIPVGKGLASSSADLVATVRAVGSALGIDTSAAAAERWLRLIEPTDGVMHDGCVAFAHKQVRLLRRLGALPPLTIVAVDEGGQVDTEAFNQRPKRYPAASQQEYAELLEHLSRALATGDVATVGAIATRSAVLNQRLQPKRALEPLIRIAADTGALGVVCAHSGTMAGLLFPARSRDAVRAAVTAVRAARAGHVSVIRCLAQAGEDPVVPGDRVVREGAR